MTLSRSRKSPNSRKTSVPRTSLWLEDARSRLLALLPELLVCIVTATCMTTVMTYGRDADVVFLVLINAVTQIIVQVFLYVITYLVRDGRTAAWGWLIAYVCATSLAIAFSLTVRPNGSLWDEIGITVVIMSAVGAMVFYLTRLRVVFILFVIEVVGLVDALRNLQSLLVVHAVCICSLAALFVMRSSAGHIARSNWTDDAHVTSEDGEEGSAPVFGIYGQITVLATVACALCLAAALAGTMLVDRSLGTHGASSSLSFETEQDATPSVTPVPEEPAFGNPRDHELPVNPTSTDLSSTNSRGSLVVVLLLALLALPVPARLIMRKLARLSLEREPQATNRAAKIYLGVISRLKAAGIERDEANTPYEFLSSHEDELVELTAPAGMELDEWMVLTDTYEKARYGDVDPTASELETCWRLYDALPACVRRSLGWQRYLTGAFWRM